MTCNAKIRPFPAPSPELVCEVVNHNPIDTDPTHSATLRDYAYAGSETTLAWMESDRRTFRGEWSRCVGAGCILPNNHRGACAL